jgi:hypothetical protein
MKNKRVVLELLRVSVVLVVLLVLTYLGFNIAQGPDRTYELGNDYYMIRWPGPIERFAFWPEEGQSEKIRYPHKVIDEDVSVFCLEPGWIAGKTYKGWFAINKETHRVYYPYKSLAELGKITGFVFREDALIKRYPIEYEVIHVPAKKFLTVMISLGIIATIGFRRSLRVLQAVPKLLRKAVRG